MDFRQAHPSSTRDPAPGERLNLGITIEDPSPVRSGIKRVKNYWTWFVVDDRAPDLYVRGRASSRHSAESMVEQVTVVFLFSGGP